MLKEVVFSFWKLIMATNYTKPKNTKKPTAREKPKKPHPDFPLTANGNGQWSKKILGKVHYFGPWDDPDGALQRYLNVKDDLYAGREPRPDDAVTVRDLANAFLTAKKSLVDSGELSPRSWNDYKVWWSTDFCASTESAETP